MSSRGLRVLGTLLIGYGLTGMLLLGVLAGLLAPPLDEVAQLAESVGEQQASALEALDEAAATARQTATAVRNVDASLIQAKAATDRAAGLSMGVAVSMRELGAAMTIDIFGIQPLAGLAPSFETSATNLDLLAGDLAAIGTALDGSRTDTQTVATGMDDLAAAITDLRRSVAASPDMSATIGALEPLRLGLLALLAWLLAAALGCVVAGLYCWLASRRRTVVVVPASDGTPVARIDERGRLD
ncbi:MAG TPA: hypothetical protein VH741_10665 [Candidatus Limnocylindrales bacterium]|jgi:hypothetical protein